MTGKRIEQATAPHAHVRRELERLSAVEAQRRATMAASVVERVEAELQPKEG